MGLLDNLISPFKGKEDNPDSKAVTQDYTTKFNNSSPAYRFTNEPFADLASEALNLQGPVLTVTASGDPVCLFAGMGAREIYATDISIKANAWAEYKWQGFLQLKYEQFKHSFVKESATWKDFPFSLPVSPEAEEIFSKMKGSSERLIESTKIFWDQGYAAACANSAGYIDKKKYPKMQKQAQGTAVQFCLTDFTAFFGRTDIPQEFTAIYISNVLDHIKDPKTNEFDLSAGRLGPIIKNFLDHLSPGGQILLNIQWSNRAKRGIEEVLKEHSFRLRKVERSSHGCGSMYIAEH